MFNSGVLVVDLTRWAKENITEHLEAWANRTEADGIGVYDQFVLNLEFHSRSRFKGLNPRWSIHNPGCNYTCKAYNLDEAFILHWSGKGKPWYPYDEIYRRRHQCLKVFREYAPDPQ